VRVRPKVALLHSKAPTLPPDVLRHQPPEKNNLVRNDRTHESAENAANAEWRGMARELSRLQ
jgi:hypothetical protein